MVCFSGRLLLFSALAAAVVASPTTAQFSQFSHPDDQQLLGGGDPSLQVKRRKLQGRFLHITDFHPDPFYRTGLSPDGEHPCHKGSDPGPSGYYGAETTSCDSPFALVNATFDWVGKHIKDEIDFVVWTGDSARHDNDESIPRNDGMVEQLNQYIVDKFVEVFGKPDNLDDDDPTNDFVVPIVPTFGNNDILPHNIFAPGPNRWTKKFSEIWNVFVPSEQRHTFARGGWFFSEVIPGKLAVFSLNTLYFFDSNSAVDGCDAKTEPGYEHFEWLRIQLQFLRERDMKAILIGHVPPARTESKQNWDETCYQKYTLWLAQYRDVVVATFYGHMNIDHFMLQDVHDLSYNFPIDGIESNVNSQAELSEAEDDQEFGIQGKALYLNELREKWSSLPRPPNGVSYDLVGEEAFKKGKKGKKDKLADFLNKIGGVYGERYSLSFVSPSVVPNFFPTLRLVEYNITGLEDYSPADRAVGLARDVDFGKPLAEMPGPTGTDVEAKKKKHKKKKKPHFPVPLPPSTTSSPGPAYSPQVLSLLGWKQMYANLTAIHAAMANDASAAEGQKDKYFKFELEYDTSNDTLCQLKDLTVRSWLGLAEKLGREEYRVKVADEEYTEASIERQKKRRKKKKKEKGAFKNKNPVWATFIRRVFVNSKSDDELDEDF